METKKIFILEKTIQKVIQQSQLPIGIIYLILRNIYQNIQRLYYQQINKQFLKQKSQEQKNENSSSQGQAN